MTQVDIGQCILASAYCAIMLLASWESWCRPPGPHFSPQQHPLCCLFSLREPQRLVYGLHVFQRRDIGWVLRGESRWSPCHPPGVCSSCSAERSVPRTGCHQRFSRNPDPLYFLKNQGVRPSLPDSIPFINLDVVAGNTRFSSMSSCQTLPGTGRWQVTDEE